MRKATERPMARQSTVIPRAWAGACLLHQEPAGGLALELEVGVVTQLFDGDVLALGQGNDFTTIFDCSHVVLNAEGSSRSTKFVPTTRVRPEARSSSRRSTPTTTTPTFVPTHDTNDDDADNDDYEDAQAAVGYVCGVCMYNIYILLATLCVSTALPASKLLSFEMAPGACLVRLV